MKCAYNFLDLSGSIKNNSPLYCQNNSYTNMKRILIFAALLFGAGVLSSAQVKDKHNYEVGVGVNAYGILGMVGGPSRYPGPGLHFEYRYDLADRFDVGGRIYYKYGKGQSAFTGEPTYGIVYNQAGVKAVADFNMRPGKSVRPYIGVGTGLGIISEKTASCNRAADIYGTVGPRIGLQMWRFRVALEFDFAYNGRYGFIGTETATALNLSFTF